MVYVSERLLWLGAEGDLVVSDVSLNNSAILSTSYLEVTYFTVVLSDLQPIPGKLLTAVLILHLLSHHISNHISLTLFLMFYVLGIIISLSRAK